jgi:tRNA A-37 threonylcarbamoyl transferase component Bud32
MQNATTGPLRVEPDRPSAAAPRYAAGAIIAGKYQLQARLGEGGMATVWLARNVLLDVPVALKLMNPEIQLPATVERFFVEARVQAQLKHPSIVHAFDYGHTELGDPFIVMEVLQGVTLRAFMAARGRVNASAAVQLMLPMIEALSHAHAHGVVHRDLKPENIFLDTSDIEVQPKLLDFGVAKLTGSQLKRHVTQSGALLGSPAYMAPEQAQGLASVDHRADIWAVCVVLYEAVSGKPAFPGSGYEVLHRVITDVLPPLQETGAGEGDLSRILALGLEKDPSLRPDSMRALGTALAQWLCDHGEAEDLHGQPISRTWRVRPAPSQQTPVVRVAAARATSAKRQRRAQAPRLLMAAAVLVAVIALPSKLKVEAEAGRAAVAAQVPAATGAAAPGSGTRDQSVESAEVVPRVAVSMPRATALPARTIVEQHRGSKPSRSSVPPSEADLGLKVAY